MVTYFFLIAQCKHRMLNIFARSFSNRYAQSDSKLNSPNFRHTIVKISSGERFKARGSYWVWLKKTRLFIFGWTDPTYLCVYTHTNQKQIHVRWIYHIYTLHCVSETCQEKWNRYNLYGNWCICLFKRDTRVEFKFA